MPDHKRKKKRGRSSKFFNSCFRSFAVDERPFLNDNNLNSRSVKTGRLGKPDFIGPSGSCGGEDVNYERSSSGHSVSRLLKEGLFNSMMVKKCSFSNSTTASDTNNTFLSIQKSQKQSEDGNIAYRMESTDMDDTSSSRCSTLLSSSSRATSSLYSSSSSSSSSTNSTSRWLSEPKTLTPIDTVDYNHQMSTFQKPKVINSSSQRDSITLFRSSSTLSYNKGLSHLDSIDLKNVVTSNPDKIKPGVNNWSTRWCLFLLLSFIVLVVYGRIYAILCTSIWFYLVPCRRVKRVNSVRNSGRVIDIESDGYKKRVIMAGLLDRTRNPLR